MFNLLFGKKKQKIQNQYDYFGNKPADSIERKAQTFFKILAILVVGYIIYASYQNEKESSQKQPQPVVQEEAKDLKENEKIIQEKIDEAFKKMQNSKEYKQVSEFVNYIKENTDKQNAKILPANQGHLIYLPFKISEDALLNDKEIKVENKKYNFVIKI
jgi:hypothetical protein